MKIVIMHQTVTKHDAIGNDIEAMYNLLRKKHYCVIYAENKLNDRLEYIEENELIKIMNQKDSLVIYHHSVYWEYGERLIKSCKGKLIIRYHNITPPEFFKPYNQFHFEQCDKGRKQTIRLCDELREAFWLAASCYNTDDLTKVDRSKVGVCPPFNKIEQLAKCVPDEAILKELMYNRKVNLLFVGRVVPNKGHLFLIDILRLYCLNYDTDIILRIVGKFDDGLRGYNEEILNRISEYGLEENVQFIGEINNSTLLSYYLGSDFFICASEHEGFCVPIIESQFFELPIIARRTSAIPETIGKNQILLHEDAKEYAAAINILYNNRQYIQYLRQNGLNNYRSRFTQESITNTFIKFLRNKLGVEI
jgi:glycosyltransferase involved in cell wall biosynthesis